MSRRRKILLGLGLGCLLGLAGYAAYLYTIAGELKDIRPHFAGSSRLVPGVPGPEDIEILADGSAAFISSLDRRAQLAGEPTRGAIFYYDLHDSTAVPINLTPDAPADFHPHGLGLYEGDSTLLFVVNHPRGDIEGDLPGEGPAHAIEVYAVDGARLTFRYRIVDEELLVAPNDVVPVGPRQFYASNDHGSGDKGVRKLEDYLRIAASHLVYYDGSRFTRLPGDYHYANGVAVSKDGTEVYLAATTDRSVFVFDRDLATSALSLRSQIFLDTGVDNIDVDSEGNLWIGSHPKLLTFVEHLHDPSVPSPSQVLRLRPDGAGGFEAVEVLRDERRTSLSPLGSKQQPVAIVCASTEQMIWCAN